MLTRVTNFQLRDQSKVFTATIRIETEWGEAMSSKIRRQESGQQKASLHIKKGDNRKIKGRRMGWRQVMILLITDLKSVATTLCMVPMTPWITTRIIWSTTRYTSMSLIVSQVHHKVFHRTQISMLRLILQQSQVNLPQTTTFNPNLRKIPGIINMRVILMLRIMGLQMILMQKIPWQLCKPKWSYFQTLVARTQTFKTSSCKRFAKVIKTLTRYSWSKNMFRRSPHNKKESTPKIW